MKKLLAIFLFVFFALVLLAGIAFDIYTNSQGIKDIFYGTAITSHMGYKSNFVGMFTAISFIVLNLLLVAGYGYFFYAKEKKIKIFPALYSIVVFFYTLYIFVRGITYIIEVLSMI